MSDKTLVTVKMLKRVASEGMVESLRADNQAAYLIFKALHRNTGMVAQLDEKLFAEATPEPKYEKGDWVVREDSLGRIGQVIGVDMKVMHGFMVKWESGCSSVYSADELLPIPPKPEKATDGYELTGEARPPKQDEYYVSVNGKDVERASWDWDYESYFGGRRWIARETNKCTECGKARQKPTENEPKWLTAQARFQSTGDRQKDLNLLELALDDARHDGWDAIDREYGTTVPGQPGHPE